MSEKRETLYYKRSNFVTALPVDYLYSPSHCWLGAEDGGVWRVGLTRFASRMLGEMVDHGFEVGPEEAVTCGQIIGWVEGFKAISDVFCVVAGNYVSGNPLLQERITLINKQPYEDGWLYRARGKPDSQCLDVHGYRALLDKTIDRILAQQKEGQG